jgi:hypothetical protein
MPRADGLTLQGRRMVAALRAHGDWMSCAGLATAVHSTGMTHYQTRLLQHMAEQGLIEFRPSYTRKWQHVLYQYRAKP